MTGLDPITAVASVINTVLDRVLPDKTAKDAAASSLISTEIQGQIAQVVAQIGVNAAEAANPSTFVAGWRPFIGWVCGTGLTYDFVVRPIANGVVGIWHVAALFQPLDLSTLLPLMLGMLGLGAYRTVEKIGGASGSGGLQ